MRKHPGDRYEALFEQVEVLRAGVLRASSAVQNVNSRVRNYLLLRKEVGGQYLAVAEFLPQPQAVLAERASSEGGQEPGGTAQGPGPRALVADAGLPAFQPDPGRLSGETRAKLRARAARRLSRRAVRAASPLLP